VAGHHRLVCLSHKMSYNVIRGSSRAFGAWPLAWPSPSGPLGRQRSPALKGGPEDRFRGAVRNDLQVPLTLEGPTRIMRGVPAF
jgi:hypothetical protein